MTQSVAATLKDMRRPTTIVPYVILAALAILGLVIGIYRLTAGLGITTNMNNTFPWGLWIAFDLVTVAFSAGAFVLAAVVSIFRRKEYHGIALPMLLAGFLGEVMVVLVLIMDLARWDQFWSVLIPDRWNFLSSMLWVALALTVYIILMVLELLPVVFERFKWGGLGRIVGYIQTLVAGVGIVLATLHNLSLGALFLLRIVGIVLGASAELPVMERAVSIADFLASPAWIIGGVLLWRRKALGYAGGLGLLFSLSMLFIGLIVLMILQPVLMETPFAPADVIVVAAMGLVCFVPFGLFLRGVISGK